MSGKFELKRTSDEQFMFNLKAGNGEIILTSERYKAKASAQNGIQAVQNMARLDEHYRRRTSKSDEPYFVLTVANHQIIGISEMYSSKSAMEKGIRSVKQNASRAETTDRTTER